MKYANFLKRDIPEEIRDFLFVYKCAVKVWMFNSTKIKKDALPIVKKLHKWFFYDKDYKLNNDNWLATIIKNTTCISTSNTIDNECLTSEEFHYLRLCFLRLTIKAQWKTKINKSFKKDHKFSRFISHTFPKLASQFHLETFLLLYGEIVLRELSLINICLITNNKTQSLNIQDTFDNDKIPFLFKGNMYSLLINKLYPLHLNLKDKL